MMKTFVGTVLLSSFLLFSSHALAGSEEDIAVTAGEITAAGCTASEQKFAVSMQALSFFEMNAKGNLKGVSPNPQQQRFLSAQCGKEGATIYYYTYKDRSEARTALVFAESFIWGPGGRSKMHPEAILLIDRQLVVLSAQPQHPLGTLLARKVAYLTVPDAVLQTISQRLKCASSSDFDSPCGVLQAFLGKESLPLDAGGPYFGMAWDIDAQGKVIRDNFEAIELWKKGSETWGYWMPIRPDNPKEKDEMLSFIATLKKGQKLALPKDFRDFLDGMQKKLANPLIVRNGNNYFLKFENHVAWLKRTSSGIVLISTREHISGKPGTVIMAYFWNRSGR